MYSATLPHINVMNESNRSELERFSDELNSYRLFAERNRHHLDQEPLLDRQLIFWFESVRFLLSELEIWDRLGNNKKWDETVGKLQKALSNVNQLITSLLEKDDGWLPR